MPATHPTASHCLTGSTTRRGGATPGTRVKGRVLYQPQPQPSLQGAFLVANAIVGTLAAHAVSVPLPRDTLNHHDKAAWTHRSALRRTHGDVHTVVDASRESTCSRSRASAAPLSSPRTSSPASSRGSQCVTQQAPRPDVWQRRQDVRAVASRNDLLQARLNVCRAATRVQRVDLQERRPRTEAGAAEGQLRATRARAAGLSVGADWSSRADRGGPRETSNDKDRAALRRIALWRHVD